MLVKDSCARSCKAIKDCVSHHHESFRVLRNQDLVPYMVRRQFLPPAAVDAAAQGGSPHGKRAGLGPVAVSPEQGNPEAPPDGGEGGGQPQQHSAQRGERAQRGRTAGGGGVRAVPRDRVRSRV